MDAHGNQEIGASTTSSQDTGVAFVDGGDPFRRLGSPRERRPAPGTTLTYRTRGSPGCLTQDDVPATPDHPHGPPTRPAWPQDSGGRRPRQPLVPNVPHVDTHTSRAGSPPRDVATGNSPYIFRAVVHDPCTTADNCVDSGLHQDTRVRVCHRRRTAPCLQCRTKQWRSTSVGANPLIIEARVIFRA